MRLSSSTRLRECAGVIVPRTWARCRAKGKSAVICADYSEASKFGDIWLSVKQGTDSALAMAMGHVILKEYHVDRKVKYFRDYVRQYTDMPMLVCLTRRDGMYVPDRFVRCSDFDAALGEANNPEWKTVAYNEADGAIVAPRAVTSAAVDASSSPRRPKVWIP